MLVRVGVLTGCSMVLRMVLNPVVDLGSPALRLSISCDTSMETVRVTVVVGHAGSRDKGTRVMVPRMLAGVANELGVANKQGVATALGVVEEEIVTKASSVHSSLEDT